MFILSIIRAFAETVNPAYMLFLAIPEGGASRYNMNEHSQGMKDGKELAKKLSVSYSQFSQNFKTQSKCARNIVNVCVLP
jgi:hypothetical protein